jgi:protease-4
MKNDAPRKVRLGCLLMVFVLMAPVALCLPLCMVGLSPRGPVGGVPGVTVLELDLERDLGEAPGPGSLLSSSTMTVRDVVFALQKGALDPRVRGLFVRVGGAGHGLATSQEVRDAVLAFRAAGKPTLAFSETFGEMTPGTGGWFIATAFEDIWLQPAGTVSLAPLLGETPFVRDGLARLGVEPTFAARKEYKNAPNTFTEQGFTEPHKEASLRLLTSAQAVLVDEIAQQRPALGTSAAVSALLADGPFVAQDAVERKLVDHLGYREEAIARIKERAGPGAKLLWLARYHERVGTPYDDDGASDRTVVAVVTAVGQIHRGRSNHDPLTGVNSVGSDTTSSALRQATMDPDVRGIILRIDSPGGSVVASETIAHAVELARKAGKPVVASFANVAGSGGYYIAMNADAIVAQRGTITGSIGVYAGKMVTTKFWDQLGVNFETLTVDDADISFYSTDAPYTPAARARLDAVVDGIYTSFIEKVAAGRHRTVEEIEPVARGRVWTGVDAKEHGLVDTLGGWPQTLAVMREKLSLPEGSPLGLRDFPRPLPPWQQLLATWREDPGESSDEPAQQFSATAFLRPPTTAQAMDAWRRLLLGGKGSAQGGAPTLEMTTLPPRP